ncbi:hypothetical protein BH10PSE7_BH10PSE7_31450 [soil metagenome]
MLDTAVAIATCRKAIAEDPEILDSFAFLARALVKSGKNTEAFQVLQSKRRSNSPANELQDARTELVGLPAALQGCFKDLVGDQYRTLAELFIRQGHFGQLKDYETYEYTRRKLKNFDYRTLEKKFGALQDGKRINFTRRHAKVIRKWRDERFGDSPHYFWMLRQLSSSHSNQTPLRSYLGRYQQIYAMTTSPHFKRGNLKIEEKNGVYCYESNFKFRDAKTIETEGRDLGTFTGFMFYLHKHIYFSGLGNDYSQPMACYPMPLGGKLSDVVLRGPV